MGPVQPFSHVVCLWVLALQLTNNFVSADGHRSIFSKNQLLFTVIVVVVVVVVVVVAAAAAADERVVLVVIVYNRW